MIHTFNKYYCKKDGNALNDNDESRKSNCEIIGYMWKICDECVYFGVKQ